MGFNSDFFRIGDSEPDLDKSSSTAVIHTNAKFQATLNDGDMGGVEF